MGDPYLRNMHLLGVQHIKAMYLKHALPAYGDIRRYAPVRMQIKLL